MSHHGKNLNNGIPEGNLPKNAGSPAEPADPTGRNVQLETRVNNPVGTGPSHRGDRRDTHPSFSTGKGGRGSTAGPARDGGRSGPLGASTRKSGPKAN